MNNKRNYQSIIIAFLFFVSLLSCNTNTQKQEVENNNRLVGSWKFVADQVLDSANNIIQQDVGVEGLLIYLPGGKMSVQLLWNGIRDSTVNQTMINKNGAMNGLGDGPNTLTNEQAKKIVDTYDAYFGSYYVDWKNNIVTHIVTGNLRPEKVGTAYKRAFQIRGDSLFLKSTDPAMTWQTAWIKNKK